MSPKTLFWVPAFLRIGIVFIGIGILWHFFDARVGMSAGFIAMIVLVAIQLHYLYRLNGWLDSPENAILPQGWGAWTDVFSRLYRLHRNDIKNKHELTEWLTRFRQAMNLLPDGVVIMDDVLLIEWCNPAAQKHLGLDIERDKGMTVTNIVRSPEFSDYLMRGQCGKPLAMMIQDRQLLVQIIPFENRRRILVTHDNTESIRIEKMRRDFIANASHELRTPLTVINGFLEIASEQPKIDAKTRMAHLKLMAEQGRRMQFLVEDMLALTRLESIEYPVHPARVGIANMMNDIYQEAKALSGNKHVISVVVDGPDINGSSEELRSAFSNLVSNAVRYTPEHGAIQMTWKNAKNGPEFSVQDTGIGIRAEHISRLTERFYRVDKGRSCTSRGTGLGLAIVKHVLLRHGAVLAVTSQPEKGSTFTAKFEKNSIFDAEVRS